MTLGFGFLAVAVFDIFHIIYYPELKLFPKGHYDLATSFWVIGRNAIIALFIFIFFHLLKPKKKSNMISYRHIYLSILLLISAGFCSTRYVAASSFSSIFGHILKVVCYLYIYYSIYVNNVKYPYEKIKFTKSKLRASKKELYDILNGLPLALATYDNSLHIAFINDKALELLECSRKDVLGLTAEEISKKFMPPKEGSRENLVLQCSANDKNISSILRQYATLKGNTLDLNISTYKYNRGIMVSFSDAKKDQELADLKIQTLNILNSLSNFVLLTDSTAKVILANKAFLDFIEMEFKDIEGMHINDLNTLLSFRTEGTPYNDLRQKSNIGNSIEASLKTLNGTTKHLLFHSSPIKNTKDQIIGHMGVSSDITQYKKDQEKMLQQEKLAIIGQMGAGIVHETKNHLASIKGYCQLLSINANEQSKKYIERIECISADLNRVIIDFLTIAKPTQPVMDIISLNEIIESVRYMLESPSFIKGVKIDIGLDEFDGDIIADESGIKQIILNMTKNAIEAMSDVDDARLSIQTRLNHSGDKALLIISDNGHGLSTEELKMLGTPFFTTKAAGTGLGLSVCFKIIKEHKGKVRVKSTKGKGTTFKISFPLYMDKSYDSASSLSACRS
jgi:PAS domain S-box-containing protein